MPNVANSRVHANSLFHALLRHWLSEDESYLRSQILQNVHCPLDGNVDEVRDVHLFENARHQRSVTLEVRESRPVHAHVHHRVLMVAVEFGHLCRHESGRKRGPQGIDDVVIFPGQLSLQELGHRDLRVCVFLCFFNVPFVLWSTFLISIVDPQRPTLEQIVRIARISRGVDRHQTVHFREVMSHATGGLAIFAESLGHDFLSYTEDFMRGSIFDLEPTRQRRN